MSVIEINNLTKDYGDSKGVFNLSFSIEKGEVFGFLGPNGAGKTTTIRNLMGFTSPDQGSCSILGLDCKESADRIQKRLGYIPGEMAFFDEMTGSDFISFIAKYRGLHDMKKAKMLINRFQLDPSGRLKKMSKGMKQKVGIVCAFMHDPKVLILDEPTSGLDPLMQNVFIDLINEEKKRGKTILMSSHTFEEVEKTCDRVGIIRKGHLVAVDTIEDLKENQRKVYLVTLSNENDVDRFIKENIQVVSVEGNMVKVAVERDINPFIKILSSYSLSNLSLVNQSLEEIFLKYYGGKN